MLALSAVHCSWPHGQESVHLILLNLGIAECHLGIFCLLIHKYMGLLSFDVMLLAYCIERECFVLSLWTMYKLLYSEEPTVVSF